MRKHSFLLLFVLIFMGVGLLASCSVPPRLEVTNGHYIRADELFDRGIGFIDNWEDAYRDESVNMFDITSDRISIPGLSDSMWDEITYYEDESINLIQYSFGSKTDRYVIDYNCESSIAFLYSYDMDNDSIIIAYGTYTKMN